MHKQKKYTYHQFLWLLGIIVFASSLFAGVFAPFRATAATLTGQWVDQTTIVVDNTIYRDSNPFDGNHNYRAIGNSGCTLKENISINSYGSDGSSGTLKDSVQGSDGQCNGSSPISLQHSSNRLINAYQVATGVIFMPSYKTVSGVQQNGVFTRVQNNGSLGKTGDNCATSGLIGTGQNLDNGKCVVYVACQNAAVNSTSGTADANGCTADINNQPTVAYIQTCNGKSDDSKMCLFSSPTIISGAMPTVTLDFSNNRQLTVPPSLAKYSVTVDKNGNVSLSSGSASADNATVAPTCESSGFSFSWAFCPIINGLADTVDSIFTNFVQPSLRTNSIDFTSPSGKLFPVWASFRDVADVLLVIAMLVVVFGQAIGGGLIEAYTAKKILPRLVAAAILINLSIYIVGLSIDVTNVLGRGISGLIYSPFGQQNWHFKLSGATSGLGLAATFTGIWAVAAGAGAVISFLGLFVLLPAVIAALGVFVTIIIREGLIIFLAVSSPVAFVLYCLPNTEKYFRQWWSLFMKTLLVYPIIMLVFAITDVLAVTINAGSNGGANATSNLSLTGWMTDIVSILLVVLPLFLIPYAFKMSGGAIGAIHSSLQGFGKKGVEAVKGNPNDQNSLRNRTKRNVGENFTRTQSRYAQEGRDQRKWRTNPLRKARGVVADSLGNVDQRLSNYNRLAAERRDTLTGHGNDDLIYAGGGYILEAGQQDVKGNVMTAPRTYFNAKGDNISRQTYQRGKALYGQNISDVGQSLGYRLLKHQTDDDIAQYRFAFDRNAEANNWDNGEMLGVHAAATYPHKGMVSSEWYSTPVRNGRNGPVSHEDISQSEANYGKFIGDFHKTRQAFQLSSLRDGDFRAMSAKQNELQTKLLGGGRLTDTEATQLAQTYEVFDAASQQLQSLRPGEDGSVSAAGATAASQPIIREAVQARRDAGISLGVVSDGTRSINVAPAVGPPSPGVLANVTGESDRGTVVGH